MKPKYLALILACISLNILNSAKASHSFLEKDCKLNKAIDLETDDPRYPFHKPLMLKYVVFDKKFQTEALAYSEHYDMALKLFRLWSDSTEKTENLGVAYRPGDNQPWWLFAGFSTSYPSTYKIKASLTKEGDKKIYYTRVEYPWIENRPAPVVETKVVIEKTSLISLELTVPIEKPCVLSGNHMYCEFIEQNETLCLKEAQLSYSREF